MNAEEFLSYFGPFPDPILLVTVDGLVIFANAAAAGLPGASSGALLRDIVADSQGKLEFYLRSCARNREYLPGALTFAPPGAQPLECRVDGAAARPGRNGEPALVLLRFRPKESSGSPFHALNDKIRALAKEVTERKRSQSALEEQRTWLHTVLTSIGDAVITTDAERSITFMNPVAESLTGWSLAECVGKLIETVFHILNENSRERSEDPVAHALREGAVVALANHTILVARSGRETAIDDTAAPIRDASGNIIGVVLIFRDVSDARRNEEQLRQTQKLESLGVLAGGIAHDFNNLLTGIIGGGKLALDDIPETSPARALLQQVVLAGERAAHLTRQMLAYAGKGKFLIEPIDLGETVRDIVALLRASIPKSVELRMDLAPDLPRIEADQGQIQQLVMNLIINAGEAIGENEPGMIVVSTGIEELEPESGRKLFPVDSVTAGPYVYLEVRDTGCGMDETTRQRMFDPFFTTKFAGRGLGLAAVLGIVRSHHGVLDVRTSVGHGTTFRILLPPGSEHAGRVARRHDDHRCIVLVVDDEEVVRAVARATFERHGCRVLLARNGAEGLEMFRSNPAVSLVVLDMTMPVLDGRAALEEMRRSGPDVPVIVLSGYSEGEVRRRFEGLRVDAFLQKPFAPARLLDAARTALGPERLARAS